MRVKDKGFNYIGESLKIGGKTKSIWSDPCMGLSDGHDFVLRYHGDSSFSILLFVWRQQKIWCIHGFKSLAFNLIIYKFKY